MTFIVQYKETSILEQVIEAKSKAEAIEKFEQMIEDDRINFSKMEITNEKTTARKAKKNEQYGYWY